MYSAAPMHTVVQTSEENAKNCATSRAGACRSPFRRNTHTSLEAQRAAALHMFVVKLQSTLQHNAEQKVQEAFTRWQYASINYKESSADVSTASASSEDISKALVAVRPVEHRSSAADAANSPQATSSKAIQSRSVPPLESASDDQLQLTCTVAASDQSAANSAAELEAAEFQCLICMERNQMKNMYNRACGHTDHTYCVDCIAQHCGTQLLDMGCMPRCPGRNCNYELTRAQLTAVWQVSRADCYHNNFMLNMYLMSFVVSVSSAIANLTKLLELSQVLSFQSCSSS
jgi:hypothetical protein